MMRRRFVMAGLTGLTLAPSSGLTQVLGDACRPDPAELQGAFVVTFGDPDPGLWFVATRHSISVGSQTFRTVAAAIAQAGPKAVIVEGLATAAGDSPDVETLRGLDDATFKGGEARYAAMIAAKRGVPFVGGEASAVDVNTALLASYPVKDVIRAYLTRDILGYARLKPFPGEPEFRAFAHEAADRLAVTDGRLWDPALADGTWYLEAHGLPDRSMAANAGTPCGGDDVGRILGQVTEIRNRRLYALIASRVKTARPVVVVYGSGHLRALRAPLEQLLGPARVRPMQDV